VNESSQIIEIVDANINKPMIQKTAHVRIERPLDISAMPVSNCFGLG